MANNLLLRNVWVLSCETLLVLSLAGCNSETASEAPATPQSQQPGNGKAPTVLLAQAPSLAALPDADVIDTPIAESQPAVHFTPPTASDATSGASDGTQDTMAQAERAGSTPLVCPPGSAPADRVGSVATLSPAFQSVCASCHGSVGQGLGGSFPRVPGKLSVAEYIQVVRKGATNMPAYPASVISDPQLSSDFNALTARINANVGSAGVVCKKV